MVFSKKKKKILLLQADADNASLMGRIQELQKQLLESRYESVVLREQLVHSQMELSQLKDRGLVRANLRGYSSEPQAVPPGKDAAASSASVAANSSWKGSSPPSAAASSAMDAFRVQLNYAQIKSKLRPTNNGHYDEEPQQQQVPQMQQQQMQQQQQQQLPSMPAHLYQWDLSE